ncbi:MAG: Ig-like domain repeat protein [Methanosphaera sp.]|nr:Ig-like domain repeat protein [Methanosphaera sp.]
MVQYYLHHLHTIYITATQGQNITINIQVTQDQNPVNTGKIIIKINGKTIKDANGKVIFAKVTNGIASIEYTLPESMKAKDYTLTAIYTSIDNEKIETTKILTVI